MWQHKPDDYQQEQLEFENIKHKTNGYLIHIPLGLRKRLFYFRTVYMYTNVRSGLREVKVIPLFMTITIIAVGLYLNCRSITICHDCFGYKQTGWQSVLWIVVSPSKIYKTNNRRSCGNQLWIVSLSRPKRVPNWVFCFSFWLYYSILCTWQF